MVGKEQDNSKNNPKPPSLKGKKGNHPTVVTEPSHSAYTIRRFLQGLSCLVKEPLVSFRGSSPFSMASVAKSLMTMEGVLGQFSPLLQFCRTHGCLRDEPS